MQNAVHAFNTIDKEGHFRLYEEMAGWLVGLRSLRVYLGGAGT